jgi:hypothetical protein
MKSTVTHRSDTVAMKSGTATVASPYAARTYVPTVPHRGDLPRSRAYTGAHARAGKYMRAIGTVATVCYGALRRNSMNGLSEKSGRIPSRPSRPSKPHCLWAFPPGRYGGRLRPSLPTCAQQTAHVGPRSHPSSSGVPVVVRCNGPPRGQRAEAVVPPRPLGPVDRAWRR